LFTLDLPNNLYFENFRQFKISELGQNICIVADHSKDYVLVIDFAQANVLIAHKSYCLTEESMFSSWESETTDLMSWERATTDLVIESPLQTAASIYIAVPGKKDVAWWISRLVKHGHSKL
jgi:hypothetical protein